MWIQPVRRSQKVRSAVQLSFSPLGKHTQVWSCLPLVNLCVYLITNRFRTWFVLCVCAGPLLEEDAELVVFGGEGGDVVKSLHEDVNLQPVRAEVRLRPLPAVEQTHRLFCGCASVSTECACLT